MFRANLLYLNDKDINWTLHLILGQYIYHLLGVILALPDVKFAKHFCFVNIVVGLPVDEVDLFQQLLLVEFQFTNHF